MIDFGDTLRKAREDKGLTIAQISDMTHMMPQQVEDLEHENFSRIAAPIYGRGFVKLYCEAVGLDPKPLVAEFMDIFNGTRAPTIRMRPGGAAKPKPVRAVASAPTPQNAPTPAPAPAPQPIPQPEPPPVPEPAPEPVPQPPPLEDDDEPLAGIIRAAEPVAITPAPAVETRTKAPAFRLESETIVSAPPQRPEPTPFTKSAPRGPSRYAAPEPLPPFKSRTFEIPPAAWRILVLALVASLILYGLVALVRKVWNAATLAPQEPAPVSEVAETPSRDLPGAPEPAPEPASPATVSPAGTPAKRTPLPVPPLYID